MKELILGGIRSGKSRLAEQRAVATGLAVTYIATATAGDDEMRRRIGAHQTRRNGAWALVEEPYDLATALGAHAAAERCLLVDCLTLWLTNVLLLNDDQRLAHACDGVVALLPQLPGHIILVGNETSMGIIPLGELTRRFCDTAGVLHQALAGVCDRVILTVAGLPYILKGAPS